MFYRNLLALTSALFLIIGYPSYSRAQTTDKTEENDTQSSTIFPDKLALIKELLRITNSASIVEQMLQSMTSESAQSQMIDSIISASEITDETEWLFHSQKPENKFSV